jgi:hypothetical protein
MSSRRPCPLAPNRRYPGLDSCGTSGVPLLLLDRGAAQSIRARVPGHFERPGELLDISAAEYGARFPLRKKNASGKFVGHCACLHAPDALANISRLTAQMISSIL